MTAIEKKIIIENVNMLDFLGFNDSNLRILEDRFNTSITVRGDNVILKGVIEEVEIIEKVLKEMTYVLNTSGRLGTNDVNTILDLTIEGKEIVNEEEFDSIVLYTKKDVIKARTPGQINYINLARKNDICFAIGPAGTGKTYLAVAIAVSALKRGLVKKLILARPAVEAGESLGFLPGDFREKIDPYLRPLYDALDDMIPSEKLKNYIEKRIIEIVPLAYMRGRTLNNAYVILDEAQNSTTMQMKMFLTRLGGNSKSIITGDITQIDLPAKQASGLIQAKEILSNVEGVAFVYFDKSDVVRHKLVKDIIDAYEKFNNNKNGS
ncbi:MAG: PhoH family protein [Ignavibacteriota bacterium]|nr:MAG: PhoH family protein [Chlorobiota bacterium]MBE7476587.1 PhoH family protein [Ignavibacteriales bacterium]MBL1123727.1 PhoH family protein [Ignavibacteriota bacterium]MCC7093792.1 PhoH family protein [Ignavibacteriaceae bacterium]MCE7855614.1 PhoH family protein [Ignavibacteria bacterium CHB3]MEB2294976.1 PhoH family protein [Ignavibacteria bacterium]